MRVETDEFVLEYKTLEELSYFDSGNDYIDLYKNGDFVGYLTVYTDVENEEREYVCVNYEIVYLDTIQIIND